MSKSTILHLGRHETDFTAAICVGEFELETLRSRLDTILHPDEMRYFEQLKSLRRQLTYSAGRYVAKQALHKLGVATPMADILIDKGIFEQPVTNIVNTQVSISHSENIAVAIAFPEAHPIAVDLEAMDDDKIAVIRTQVTATEVGLVSLLPLAAPHQYKLLWTAKEAISKVIKCGLMTSFQILEIKSVEQVDNYFVSYYKNFSQYKTLTFIYKNYMISIVLPKYTDLSFAEEIFSGSLAHSA